MRSPVPTPSPNHAHPRPVAAIGNRWERSLLGLNGLPTWAVVSVPLLLKHRVSILALGHLAVFAAAYWIAFALRFDFRIPSAYVSHLMVTLPAVLAVKLLVFYAMGHFHGWWRYVTFADLIALLRASVLSLLLMVLLNHYVLGEVIPRAVVIMDCLVTALLLGTMRSSWRLCREHRWMRHKGRRPTLMVGTDHESGVLAHQLHAHPELPYRITGFLDLDGHAFGTRLGGIPVMGSIGEVRDIAASHKVTDILVIADSLPGHKLRELMDQCDQAELTLKMIPSVVNRVNGHGVLPVRDVNINDLLRRDPVELDMRSISQDIRGRTVLVTGAGGSIGSEICRQLVRFRPHRLVLVDQGENSLFLINNELQAYQPPVSVVPLVADVVDTDQMRHVFDEHRPDFVLHAAAHKHVALMESNVAQCIRNNVFGTKCVADLADEFAAAKFVLISTDKAVNPASVMGASKQLAERYIQMLAQESATAFMAVRFGNVLGSNGSVVPIFREQIQRGGPITITDERMMRFFMTIPEASQLVLQAAAMGRGGEIFVLEMGKPVRIVDLARDLVRLSGLPTSAIEIEIVGMRSGEKLFEELYFDDERTLSTDHPKVRAAYHRPGSLSAMRELICELQPGLEHGDDVARQQLMRLVPEYRPSGLPCEIEAVMQPSIG